MVCSRINKTGMEEDEQGNMERSSLREWKEIQGFAQPEPISTHEHGLQGSNAPQPHMFKTAANSQTVLNLIPGIDIPSPSSSFLACQLHSKAASFSSVGGEGDRDGTEGRTNEQQPASLLVGSEGLQHQHCLNSNSSPI